MELSPLGIVELVLMLGVFERNSRDRVRSLASLSGENRNRSEDQHHSPSCLGFELYFNLFFLFITIIVAGKKRIILVVFLEAQWLGSDLVTSDCFPGWSGPRSVRKWE